MQPRFMKKNKMTKAQPLRVLKPRSNQPNNVRAKQRMDEYIQRYHKALYQVGEAKQ